MAETGHPSNPSDARRNTRVKTGEKENSDRTINWRNIESPLLGPALKNTGNRTPIISLSTEGRSYLSRTCLTKSDRPKDSKMIPRAHC